MDDANSVLIKLQDLSQFVTIGTFDDKLKQQATMTAGLIGAETCSIMLINGGDGEDLRMSVCAAFGPIPAAAWTASVGKGEGIAGHVLASARPLLIQDILSSQFAHLARRAEDPRRSLMLAPISIDGKIIGMVNVCARRDGNAFTEVELHTLEVIALMIGKSIQVMQLQSILHSRFVELALAQEVQAKIGSAIAGTAYQNPDQVAKILAKSLFKEMTKAGFGSAQIISTASEIIGLLSENLQRHSERAARHGHGGKRTGPGQQ